MKTPAVEILIVAKQLLSVPIAHLLACSPAIFTQNKSKATPILTAIAQSGMLTA